MDEHRTHYTRQGIEHTVCRESPQFASPKTWLHHHTGYDERKTADNRIDDHRLHVEAKIFPCPCSYTRHANAYQLDQFARLDAVEHLKAGYQFQHELRGAVFCRNRQVHHQFDNQKDIDTAAEDVVYLLLFPCLFCSHIDTCLLDSQYRTNPARSCLDGRGDKTTAYSDTQIVHLLTFRRAAVL